jgi:peptide/nickel transport system substrate-binding protein
VPELATEWTQKDDLTWTFTLREGVKFHDGSDFDADDVVASITRLKSEALACFTDVKFFSDVEFTPTVKGPYELELKTSRPVPILPTLLSFLAVNTDSISDEPSRAPIGTGPFKFTSWTAGQEIVVDAFDGYWGEKPVVTKATYLFRTESSIRASMVAIGEADIAPSIAMQDATNADMDFGYLNSETLRLRLDGMIAPTDDVRVRKAINHAIDREAFVGSLLPEDVIIATQLVGPSIFGHNDALVPYSYDPELAKQLLAEAAADGVAVDTPLKLIGRQNIYPNSQEVLTAIVSMLQDVGLSVSLEITETAQNYQLMTRPFAEDRANMLMEDQHDNNAGDASFTLYSKYHTDGAQSTVSDAVIDDLITRGTAAVGDERQQLFRDAFERLHDELAADVELFHMIGFTRVNPRVQFTPTIATNTELQLSQITF